MAHAVVLLALVVLASVVLLRFWNRAAAHTAA
jgi:hypothetical protein